MQLQSMHARHRALPPVQTGIFVGLRLRTGGERRFEVGLYIADWQLGYTLESAPPLERDHAGAAPQNKIVKSPLESERPAGCNAARGTARMHGNMLQPLYLKRAQSELCDYVGNDITMDDPNSDGQVHGQVILCASAV